VTWSCFGQFNGHPFDKAMRSQGHQVIHQVVLFGNAMENIGNMIGFFGFGH